MKRPSYEGKRAQRDSPPIECRFVDAVSCDLSSKLQTVYIQNAAGEMVEETLVPCTKDNAQLAKISKPNEEGHRFSSVSELRCMVRSHLTSNSTTDEIMAFLDQNAIPHGFHGQYINGNITLHPPNRLSALLWIHFHLTETGSLQCYEIDVLWLGL